MNSENVGRGKVGHEPLCPNCRVGLVMSERQSVTIDYCPQCRGIWLDRDELDKIIDKSVLSQDSFSVDRSSNPMQNSYPEIRRSRKWEESDRHKGRNSGHRDHRRKSWLQDLFD